MRTALTTTAVSEPTYPPRTVAYVALGSLVAGFVAVFGGGMLLLRPRSPELSPATTAPLPVASAQSSSDAGASPLTDPLAALSGAEGDASPNTNNGGGEADPSSAGGGAEPASPPPVGAVTVGAPAISRCFDAGPPTPIAGANCGQLPALQQHIASRATQVAACGRGAHGRLALVLDFRFSTSFARGWGSPASTIARAGDVTSCVKDAILPLPYANMPHDHDRYLVIVPIDF
jgi:hypothetical protein